MDGRRPSADAEARWSAAEARYARGFVVAALVIAAGIVSTLVLAKLELRPLAIVCSIVALAAMAWTIGLIVRRHRTFRQIMIDDGLTATEAARENLRRHGG
jgi:uncharacterized protein YybS (DUF2232 family)